MKPAPPSMSFHPEQLLHFEGGNALSAFRAQALLPAAGGRAALAAVHARHVHWVCERAPLDARRRATGSTRC